VSQAAGWYRDPFHRGQERYYDGRVWTQGTRPEVLEVPEGAVGPDASGDEQPARSVAADTAMERLSAALGEPAAAAEAPSFAPLGARVGPGATALSGQGGWGPPTMDASGPHRPKRDRRGRNVMLGVAAAALLLVAGGVSAAVVLGGSGNASAEEAVANAATQTNAQSADMSMSINMSFLGMQENLTANGAFDFAHKLGTMTMTIPVNGTQYTEQEILDGSTVYVNTSGLGSGLAPSKPWVSENVGQLGNSASGLGTLDPTALLQQLQSTGGTVTSLGATTYDGTAVTEYSATLPSSAMMGAIGKLPSSLQKGVSGLNLPDMHMNVYVTQDGLLKALAVPTYAVSFAGQSLSIGMTMVLSNYGTTVNVTPPPADQVEPLPPLPGGLGNSGSTGNSGSGV
jgi:outer membrane lipoprotein-sorting protein